LCQRRWQALRINRSVPKSDFPIGGWSGEGDREESD
jgi:hypothetical protein